MSDNGNASPAAEGGGGLAHRDRSKDIRHKWSSFNSQAARRTIDQQLTFEQFSVLVKMACNYCGMGGNMGIDRIDSSVRTYALNNCVPCCATCNFMKGSLPTDVFMAKILAIAAWRAGKR
jgi:hypothetical protein